MKHEVIKPVRMVPVKEAKAKLTELLRAVEAGEQVVVTRNGKQVAQLVLHVEEEKGLRWEAMAQWKRDHGYPEKGGWVSPDFDDELPEDFLITPLPDEYFVPKFGPDGKRV
jgi:antitoxin (DNA-binding transcriptional repressor) of toxin-antitoxin stability system